MVDLHAGEKKRRHFHHRASSCREETVIHLSAKQLVVEAVAEWRAGGHAPVFVRRCAEPGCEIVTRQSLPKKVLRAEDEHPLRSGHVVDVALLGPADIPVAAVEILVTHAVDEQKAFELGIPWIEVDGASVCASRGRVLEPVRDRFLPWLCKAHVHRRGEAPKEERESRQRRTALLRELDYRIEDYPAYRVADVTTCPNGHEALRFAWDGREPPWPRPPHVVAVASDEDVLYDATRRELRSVFGFRRRWASACARCGARIRDEEAP